MRAKVALTRIGEPAVGPLIEILYEEASTESQRAAIEVLARLGRISVPHLVKIIEDENEPEHVKDRVVEALAHAGEPAALAIARLFESGSADHRYWASLVVAQAGSGFQPAVPAMTAALRDENEIVRHHCALALGDLGRFSKPAIPALIRSLGAQDGELRRCSARALAAIGIAEEHLPALLEHLEDADDQVHAAVADALGGLGANGKPALPRLMQSTGHPSPRVQLSAARAIWRIAGIAELCLPSLVRVLSKRNGAWRERAIPAMDVLLEIGAPARPALPVVYELANDARPDVRAQAVLVLGHVPNDERNRTLLRAALDDRSLHVRVCAARGMWLLTRDPEEVLPVLMGALAGYKWPFTQALAADTLGEIGAAAESAIPALTRMLAHPVKEPRIAAARALERLRTR